MHMKTRVCLKYFILGCNSTDCSIVMSIDNHTETINIISLVTNLLRPDIQNESFRDTKKKLIKSLII